MVPSGIDTEAARAVQAGGDESADMASFTRLTHENARRPVIRGGQRAAPAKTSSNRFLFRCILCTLPPKCLAAAGKTDVSRMINTWLSTIEKEG